MDVKVPDVAVLNWWFAVWEGEAIGGLERATRLRVGARHCPAKQESYGSHWAPTAYDR